MLSEQTCPMFHSAVQDSNSHSFSRESEVLPLNHCATLYDLDLIKPGRHKRQPAPLVDSICYAHLHGVISRSSQTASADFTTALFGKGEMLVEAGIGKFDTKAYYLISTRYHQLHLVEEEIWTT